MIRASAAYPPIDMKVVEVEASQTAVNVGPDRAGVRLSHVEIYPETVSPGTVELRDGTAAPVEIYAGGSGATRDRYVGAASSTDGGWSITTGAGVRVLVTVERA